MSEWRPHCVFMGRDEDEDGAQQCYFYVDCNRCNKCAPHCACHYPVRSPATEVHHPAHYTRGKIEVIAFIEDQELNFNLGNVVKYSCRAGFKDASKHVQDLEKAAFYLAHEIERVKGRQIL